LLPFRNPIQGFLQPLPSLQNTQGQYGQAEESCRKALAIRRKILGDDHPDTATCSNNLAE
jgi:hypothetical protein